MGHCEGGHAQTTEPDDQAGTTERSRDARSERALCRTVQAKRFARLPSWPGDELFARPRGHPPGHAEQQAGPCLSVAFSPQPLAARRLVTFQTFDYLRRAGSRHLPPCLGTLVHGWPWSTTVTNETHVRLRECRSSSLRTRHFMSCCSSVLGTRHSFQKGGILQAGTGALDF